ncbi:MAG: patatin-like phospholipase family protein [Treponema sp.]|nr:patatin-like phospholipase family protein [Treponema sp.]
MNEMKTRAVAFFVLCLILAARAAFATDPSPGGPRPRVALVLSGGAALGMAHAGVIEIIESFGIPIDMVLGTSMGAIVGGLYASGYSPEEMQKIVVGLDWPKLFSERSENPGDRYRIERDARFPAKLGFDRTGLHFGEGLLAGQNVLTLFTRLTLDVAGITNFDDLPVPYRAVAADIVTGERVVFSGGSLAEAMRASMSIPGLFAPWEYHGHSLVDGGIVDNMPVDIAREMGADIVIAVESRIRGARSAEELRSGLAVTSQALELFVEENMRASRRDADLLIRPDLSRFNPTSFSAAARLIQKGREAALAMSPQLEELARRIAAKRPLVTQDTEPNRAARRPPPILSRLSFAGGDSDDRATAGAAFADLPGRPLEASKLEAAIDRAWASGRYELVSIDFAPDTAAQTAVGGGAPAASTGGAAPAASTGGATPALSADGERRFPPAVDGTVRLEARTPSRNLVMVGGYWRGVFSPLGSSDSRLSPAAYFGDISGKDSALFVSSDILGKSGARAEWFEPLGPFYFRSRLEWESRYDTWSAGEGLVVRSYYRDAGGRAALGLNLGRNGEFEGFWSLASVRASLPDDPSKGFFAASGLADSVLGMAGARLTWAAFDREPFASKGFSLDMEGRLADPSFGGDTSFVALDLRTDATVPLGGKTSLGVSLFAGSDLSGLPGIAGRLPSPEWYSLVHPGIFPLLETRSARGTGDHVFAGSVEARRRIGRMNALLGGDLYAIANLSVGAARITNNPGVDFFPLRWSGGIGIGSRFVEHLGALAMAGFVLDDDPLAPLRPALSFRLGSLTEFPGDRH